MKEQKQMCVRKVKINATVLYNLAHNKPRNYRITQEKIYLQNILAFAWNTPWQQFGSRFRSGTCLGGSHLYNLPQQMAICGDKQTAETPACMGKSKHDKLATSKCYAIYVPLRADND